MIRRYQVVLCLPRWGAFFVLPLRAFRTLERALRGAARVLAAHTVTETRQRPERWVAYCRILDRKTGKLVDGRRIDYDDQVRLEAPVRIVPSVGELGWTP